MRNKKIQILFLMLALAIVSQCKSFRFPVENHTNYHSSNFICNPEPGWRNQARFHKYKSLWQEVRDGYRKENEKIRKAEIVIAGNSLVHLFTTDLLEREFPGKKIINRGIGGDMTETLLERIREDILVLQPSVLILEIGGNDLIQGKCLSLIESNYHAIIAEIRKDLPRTKIIFLSIPPTRVPELNAIVPVMNGFLADLPREYRNVVYLDTWPYMREKDIPTLKEEFLREGGRDKLHFNEKGYSVWGKLLRPHI